MYSDEDGMLAVRFSRDVIEAVVKGRAPPGMKLPPHFDEMSGAFVTINNYPRKDLRGCIGYPLPYYPLREALVRAAEGATDDPRFPRLSKRELDNIIVEVSILTPPELLVVEKPMDYLTMVRVGRDGLIVKKGGNTGLLLPQVPVEWGWDAKTFLSQTCLKAGLLPDAWLEPGIEVHRFSAHVWTETSPGGEVVRKELGE